MREVSGKIMASTATSFTFKLTGVINAFGVGR